LRKETIILLLVIAVVGLSILLVASNFSNGKINNPLATTTPFPTVFTSVTPGAIETITPQASQNIEVTSPYMGEIVKSGFMVKGNARVFENVVSIRLSDSEGNVLLQTTAYANAPDVGQFGPFEKALKFQTNSAEGTLEVYQASAKDGSDIDKVIVPVVFSK
jgi:hypothetical protein